MSEKSSYMSVNEIAMQDVRACHLCGKVNICVLSVVLAGKTSARVLDGRTENEPLTHKVGLARKSRFLADES